MFRLGRHRARRPCDAEEICPDAEERGFGQQGQVNQKGVRKFDSIGQTVNRSASYCFPRPRCSFVSTMLEVPEPSIPVLAGCRITSFA